MRGIVLFGHGSRDPQWRRPMDAIAQRMSHANPEVPVVCAFLELDSPDLATAGRDLVQRGATEVSIIPVFLGTGRHAREDTPRRVEALRSAHPHVRFVLREPVGEDSRVLDLIAAIALE